MEGTLPLSLGSTVTYRCDEGLFPPDVRTSTCTDVEGRGEWVENPGSLVCREREARCTIIPSLHLIITFLFLVNCSLYTQGAGSSNGTIVDYERLNETVLEGTVLTYQCDNRFSLTGPNTITCTNVHGVWSTDPEAIMCVLLTVRAKLLRTIIFP